MSSSPPGDQQGRDSDSSETNDHVNKIIKGGGTKTQTETKERFCTPSTE